MIPAPVIALAGNPNTGKTSVFNRLTGASARVGNYAGVTVEQQSGRWRLPSGEVEVLDIPGAYSLTTRSPEELVAVRALLGPGARRPDLVVVVADATQLVRNLYFVTQLLEAGLPVVVALNLIDAARAEGLAPDVAAVQRALGVPVLALSAKTGEGFEALAPLVERVLQRPEQALGKLSFVYPAALEQDLAALLPLVQAQSPREARALALWALLSIHDGDELPGVDGALRAAVGGLRVAAGAAGRDLDLEVIGTRWRWLDAQALGPRRARTVSATERIDRIILHPVLGSLVFVLAMGTLFESLFAWSAPAIKLTQQLFAWFGDGVRSLLPPGVFADLVVDGVIGGVGAVLVFLPQILLLFFLLGFLEDSGYMARVAFLVDRGMRSIGLNGKAFVPMISAYACAVPAVMATRTLERRRDRLVTMLALPLMTCSARLPVYTLVIAAMMPAEARVFGFIPVQVAAMVGMYLFSTFTALAAAAVIGRTMLRGKSLPLLLELPRYRLPRLPVVARQMWLRARSFLSEAGKVILVCTVLLWALLYFPRGGVLSKDYAALEAGAATPAIRATFEAQEAGERLRESYGGRLGRALEPAIAPLGFDWKIGVGLIGAFAAREVFISTLAVVHGIGKEGDESRGLLQDRIRAERGPDGRPRYTPLVGLSLMVFFALCAQCMSTLAVVRRESHSLRWPLFLFSYMTALAWVASFTVYQVGKALGFS